MQGHWLRSKVIYIELIAMIAQDNISLAPFTTLRVGGAARYFVQARTIAEVQEAIQFADSRSAPLFVLGGGSNIVVSDAGWPGVVVKIAIAGIEQQSHGSKIVFEVGAGEEWDKFVATAVARNHAGVECLSGIPGSVGGTPVQNVGAYGQEVSETIRSVTALDTNRGEIRELSNDECGFRYRTSIFNTREKGRYIILRAKYELSPDGTAASSICRSQESLRWMDRDSHTCRHPGGGPHYTRK